jgi:LysM repeat protein
MNRQTIRIVAGANLVAGCLLLQGCGMFGKKPSDQATATIPGENVEPSTQSVDQVSSLAPVESAPVELPAVHSTTPYTIQKGDTISAVAYKFNLRWQDVVAVNPGISPNKLRVGQVVQLPGQIEVSKARYVPATSTHKKVSAPKTSAPKASASAAAKVSGPTSAYVVKSGDSLSLIAHKHGVKTAALREANGLKNDKLVVGQKLKVPASKKGGAEAVTAKKTAAAAAPKTTAPKTSKEPAAKSAAAAAPAAVTPPPAVEPTPAAATPAVSAPTTVTTTAPAAPAAAESNAQTYTVKEGEDLYAVAIRWGVSPSDLKSLNNLTSTELKAGTVLKIPGAQ